VKSGRDGDRGHLGAKCRSGGSRAFYRLNASTVDISLTPDRFIRVLEAHAGESSDDLIARLHRAGDTYEIEAPEDRPFG
jgi:hypothetical protein